MKRAEMVARAGLVGVVLVGLALFLSVRTVPAGHVGVKDWFGSVPAATLQPGLHVVVPLTRVRKFSVQTIEVKEEAHVPSKEGMNLGLEASLLYNVKPESAVELYKRVGIGFEDVIVVPNFRSAVREVTASYEAKALYSEMRDRLASEIQDRLSPILEAQGIVIQSILLRKITLPDTVANAIQVKLQREQEAEQMKFVLQKEEQEAERKRIEAQGIADFQRIVTQGISAPLLQWKGIEATEKLAASPNAKIVIIGSGKDGLPIILGGAQ